MDETRTPPTPDPQTNPDPQVVPAVVPAVVPGQADPDAPGVDRDKLAEAVDRADITDDDGTGDPDDAANLSAEGY